MLRGWDPRLTLLLAISLMVAGIVVPGLIVVGYLPSTWVLNILSYSASVGGLMLGIVGLVFYTRRQRRR